MSTSLVLESIHLRVSDVAQSAEFYADRLGFKTRHVGDNDAELTTEPGGPPLLVLSETKNWPAPRDAAGLFHAALLLPNRAALADWLRFAANAGVQFAGFSDHGVSEAVYCSDADGNGLEFYADRPRRNWPMANGGLAMTTHPLDVHGLLSEPPGSRPALLSGARWGHVHVRVTDLDRSEEFYRTSLGLQVTQNSYPGARFLAADGYHHHVGINTWGNPTRPQPVDAPGLAAATFARSGLIEEQLLQDPDGIALHVRPLGATATATAGN
jgi:catechol 2,3-dioxygenase